MLLNDACVRAVDVQDNEELLNDACVRAVDGQDNKENKACF